MDSEQKEAVEELISMREKFVTQLESKISEGEEEIKILASDAVKEMKTFTSDDVLFHSVSMNDFENKLSRISALDEELLSMKKVKALMEYQINELKNELKSGVKN